uniref:LisH domain-containing protein n=2 Tax=Mesocestoides corti TaxID=53468 RepID=A0A5K3F559_MESCO
MVHLFRLKKSLQEDIQRQRAQLEQKEQKLLSKEQELDEFIKMEVERLRKSDEIDLLHRKRELEVSESRNLVEKNALETQRRQILALQEEVSEKSVLFSQMEIADYKALQMKLSAATNEINLLKEHLGQAFEEIERLTKDAATLHSERNRLAVTRQENERLRSKLEQEQADSRHERIKLNMKIDDLASENNQLNERICLQERELSRLRARLAEIRSTQTSASTVVAQAPEPFAGASLEVKEHCFVKSKAPTTTTTSADLRAPSAVVQTARNRLKLLEQESSEIEEALGRWRKEASQVLGVKKDSREVASCIKQTGSILKRTGLSTAYLANFKPSIVIPAGYQHSSSRQMPSVRPVGSVTEMGRGVDQGVNSNSMSGGTSELTVTHKSLSYEQQRAICNLSSFPPQNPQTVENNCSSQGGITPQTTASHHSASVVDTQLTDINVNQQKSTFKTTKIMTMENSETPHGLPQSALTSTLQESCLKFQQDSSPPKERFQTTNQNIDQDKEIETLVPVKTKVNEEPYLTLERKEVSTCDFSIEIPCGTPKHAINEDHLNLNINDSRANASGNGDQQSITVLDDDSKLTDKPEKCSSKGGSCLDQSEGTGSHSDAFSDTGIDPMILKYMKSMKEQGNTHEGIIESVVPREVKKHAGAPFSTFFHSDELISDSSNSEKPSEGMAGKNNIDGGSYKLESSDEFW